MEVKEQNPIWLNESHPNYLRWKRARDLSVARGRFVESIINQKVTTKNLSVLDLGSGEGGTAKVFSENNFVVSFDLSLVRLQRQKLTVISAEVIPLEAVEFKYAKTSHRAKSRWKFIKKCSSSSPLRLTYVNFQTGSEERELYTPEKSTSNIVEDFSLADSFEMTSIKYINGDALHLPFSNHSFDLIIIQDVIEHLIDTDDFYSEIKRVLKPNTSFDDRAPGCKEKIRFRLLKYMWGFEKRVATEIKILKKNYPCVVFKQFTCDDDLIKLKNELKGNL